MRKVFIKKRPFDYDNKSSINSILVLGRIGIQFIVNSQKEQVAVELIPGLCVAHNRWTPFAVELSWIVGSIALFVASDQTHAGLLQEVDYLRRKSEETK